MAKALVNRNGKTIIVKDMISPAELLDLITVEEIMEYYKYTQYILLDKIGKEKCMDYFNLTESTVKMGK